MTDERPPSGSGTPRAVGKPRRGKNGAVLLSVTDPQGYVVTLDPGCWERHITVGHPELRTRFDDLKTALERPEVIQRVSGAESVYYYYRLTGRSFYRYKDIYLLVVVERDESARTGFVKTAHLVKEMRAKGGEIVWLRRT